MPILLPCLLISKSQLQGEVREVTFRLERRHWLSRSDAFTDEAISRFVSTNSFRRLGHQLHVSVNSSRVAREFWEDDSWSHLRRDEIPEFSVCLCLDYGRLRDSADCPVDHVEVFNGVKVWYCGKREPLDLSTLVCSSGLPHSTQAQLAYVVDGS